MPGGNVQEEEITKELERKQFFLQGHDKFGCPIILILHARHAAFERNLEEIIRRWHSDVYSCFLEIKV